MNSKKKIILFSAVGAVVIAAAVTIGVFAGRRIERRANGKQLGETALQTVNDSADGIITDAEPGKGDGTVIAETADAEDGTVGDELPEGSDETVTATADDSSGNVTDEAAGDNSGNVTDEVTNDDLENVTDEVASDTAADSKTDEEPAADSEVESGSEPAKENVGTYAGGLHVEGTYLADSSNRPVILRGISSHGLGWFPEYINEAAIRQFKEEWGCNVIRLAMYTDEYNGYCSSGDEQKKNLKKIIDTGVNAAAKNDMYVIIDWHILHDGNPNQNKSEALKFFGEMSEKYADNPHVLYEICNEPNGGVSWQQVKQYALEIIPVIRKNAPGAVIIVGSPTWSQDVDAAASDPITEYENIAYSLHFYAATHKQGLRDKAATAIKKGLCLLVTEYGVCDASGNGALDLIEADTWIKFLDKNNIGYIAWNLSNKAETSSMIKSSCTKKNGFTREDMSEGGIWFLNMLKNGAGGLGPDGSGKTDAGQEEGSSSDAGLNASDTGEYAGYGNDAPARDNSEFEKYFSCGDNVVLSVANYWDSGSYYGVQLSIAVKNDTGEDLADWAVTIKLGKNVKATLKDCWNAGMSLEGRKIKIEPAAHNRVIPAGGSAADIGMILEIEK